MFSIVKCLTIFGHLLFVAEMRTSSETLTSSRECSFVETCTEKKNIESERERERERAAISVNNVSKCLHIEISETMHTLHKNEAITVDDHL